MEEDIKTIQEKLKIIESLCTDDCINKSTVIQPLIYAIENLIAGYKKLEKQMGKDLDGVYIKGVYDERDKWKSKVKEKIEELKNGTYDAKIILHQLLED